MAHRTRHTTNLTWLAVESSYAHSSLALPLLHLASSDVEHVRWSVVRSTIGEHVQSVVAKVARQQPDALAGTVYLFNRHFMLAVVRRIKRLLPHCRVILGGPEFLGDNAAFLRAESAVDAVVRGEGEAVFPEWLRRIDEPDTWADLHGLCWRDGTGEIRGGGTEAEAADLAELPSPADSAFFWLDGPFVQLETSRGCAGRCSFCTSSGRGRVRYRDPSRVRRELAALKGRGVREIRVLDRTFNANQRRAARLLRMFLNEFPGMRFHLEVHPQFLGPELRRVLSSAPAGRLHLEVGLQTTSGAALVACHRSGDTQRELDGLGFLCRLRPLEVHADLLAGLPAQSIEDVTRDLAMLSDLGPDEIQLETLKVLPGTPLAAEAESLGIVFAPDPPYEALRTPHMSAADLNTCRLLSRVVDGFYNHPSLHGVAQPAAAGSALFFPDLLTFLSARTDVETPLSLRRRFQLLHQFLAPRDAAACDELEIAWLRCGLSPSHGICPAQQWKRPVPDDASPVEGNADAAGRPDSRTWHVRQRTRECWVILDREPNGKPRCAAVFVRRAATTRRAGRCSQDPGS